MNNITEPCTTGRSRPDGQRSLAIAIPAHNEEERIGACLEALARQRYAPPFTVILLLNNCTDRTAERARSLSSCLPYRLEILEVQLFGALAHVGTARGLAMDHAALQVGPNGILLTTDADGEVAPDWLARNLAALHGDVEAVAGEASLLGIDHPDFPASLIADNVMEERFADLLDAIADRIDPEPHDPLPRHTQHSGASIAVTVQAYRRAGGIPRIAAGEDRAFFDALRRVDARLRHDPTVRVRVSGRIIGRAPGGMADTIRRRLARQDPLLDRKFETVTARVRRIAIRARLRTCWTGRPQGFAGLWRRLNVGVDLAVDLERAPFMGVAWARMEAICEALAWRPLARADLPREIDRAQRALSILRAGPSGRLAPPRPELDALQPIPTVPLSEVLADWVSPA